MGSDGQRLFIKGVRGNVEGQWKKRQSIGVERRGMVTESNFIESIRTSHKGRGVYQPDNLQL
jgi:hypothetical protein